MSQNRDMRHPIILRPSDLGHAPPGIYPARVREARPSPHQDTRLTSFGSAERCDVIAGELRTVEGLTKRRPARRSGIAVHGRIDMIPGPIVLDPGAAARTVGHEAGHVQNAGATTRRLCGALRGTGFEIIGVADVARIAEGCHILLGRKIPGSPEPARVIGEGMPRRVVLHFDEADVRSDVAVVDPRVEHACIRPGKRAVWRIALVVTRRERPASNPRIGRSVPATMSRGDDNVVAADDGCRTCARIRKQFAHRDRRTLCVRRSGGNRHHDQGGNAQLCEPGEIRLRFHRYPLRCDCIVTSRHFQSSGWSLRASCSAFGSGAPTADDSGLALFSSFRSCSVKVRGFGVPIVECQSKGFALSRSSRV